MIDGRLVLPAACCWAASVVVTVVLGSGSASVGLIGILCVACLIAVFVVALWRVPVAVWLACALVGCAAAALHSAALGAEPLHTWVQARATAEVDGVITAEPRVRTNAHAAMWQQANRQEVRLATSRVSARGGIADVEVPLVLVIATDTVVPAPGTWVHCVGRLRPVNWSVDAAAALNVSSLVVGRGPGLVDAAAQAMRSGLRDAVPSSRPEAAALVAGLAVGDESGQTVQLADDMRNSGLSHLTAVSGGNTSSIIAIVIAVATLLGLGLRARVASGLLALAFFVVVVGPQPSVLRAAVMGVIVLVGMLSGGRRAGPSVLASAVLVLCVVAPGTVATWAFALSVFAAAGIILLVPRISLLLGSTRLPPALAVAISVTLAAQIATFPVLAAMGGNVGWAALPANLLAMPVVPLITVLGLVAALLAPILPAAAAVLAWLASWPAGWIAVVAHACSHLPLARVSLPSGWWGVLASVLLMAMAAIIVQAMRSLPNVSRRGMAVALAGLILLYVVCPPDRRSWPPPDWLMIACDVGQGDALLLRVSENAAVVVDVGPDPASMGRCLADARIDSVPAVVLTHFHADHVLGLPGLLDSVPVGAVLVSPVADPPAQADQVAQWLAGFGLTAQRLTVGDERVIGQVRWRALWPRRLIVQGSIPNNASIVLVATVGGHTFLLSGDVEAQAESAIADSLRAFSFDVVKVPHHGSANASPDLTTWAPARVALISVGVGNPYGHPSPVTVSDWERHGALVARTDQSGDLAVVPVGESVGVVAHRGMLTPP